MLRGFLEVFIPLFVAVDPFGLLPIFLAVTADLTPRERHRVAAEAAATALIIALLFMFLGTAIFEFLGIESADFKIGGGILLLVLAVLDIVLVGKPAVHDREMVGIVPLGMPLIAGPAMLTTVLVFSSRPGFGYAITAAAMVANVLLLLLVLRSAHVIVQVVGMNTLKAFSKLVMVLLAAIAIQFIRSGVMEVIANARELRGP